MQAKLKQMEEEAAKLNEDDVNENGGEAGAAAPTGTENANAEEAVSFYLFIPFPC